MSFIDDIKSFIVIECFLDIVFESSLKRDNNKKFSKKIITIIHAPSIESKVMSIYASPKVIPSLFFISVIY